MPSSLTAALKDFCHANGYLVGPPAICTRDDISVEGAGAQ